jgi:murein DD-endopeptidase MepM/ murein hydrolase activator NlpD
MTFCYKYLVAALSFSIISTSLSANDKDKKIPPLPTNDTTSVYREFFIDETDDLMENHPAGDIYNNIWTSTRLNPYKMPIDSLPDSVRIDLSQFRVPVTGYITSKFGPRRYRYHYGTDIKLQTGDSVLSSFSGKVRITDYDRHGYGNYVVIRHDNGLETVYAHLSKVLVELDQNVTAGELIGLGGNTGRSTGSHLHYEIRFLGNAMNPEKIIDFEKGMPYMHEYLITKNESFYYQKEVKAMAAAKYYKIRNGDNLSRIAARNGTSVRALCRLNGISPQKVLRIGQRIRVR